MTPYVEDVTFLRVLGLGNWVKLYKAISGLSLDFMLLQKKRTEENHVGNFYRDYITKYFLLKVCFENFIVGLYYLHMKYQGDDE